MPTDIVWSHQVLLPVESSFRFDYRRADEHILWYLTKGQVEIRLGDGDWQLLGVHGLVWFPPQVPHSVRCAHNKPFTCYSFRFKANLSVQDAIIQKHAQDLLPFVDGLYRERLLGVTADPMRTESFLYLLESSLRQRQAEDMRKHVSGVLSAEQRRCLQHFVQSSIGQRICPADLADELGYTADYFSRLFKKTYGQTPKRWLMEQRMHMASYFLSDGNEPISSIAERCAYEDQNIFSRQFKQVLGCSPSEYRHRLHA